MGGEVQILEAKQDEMPLFPGDIVQYPWQGGGAYGDPLERKVEQVVEDVEAGIITAERALEMYGVVSGETARETARRRHELKQGRLERAIQGPARAERLHQGTELTQFGSGLVLSQSGQDTLQFECRCGHVFCRAQDNWKEHAAYHRMEKDELPKGITLHPSMELVEYLCPACGQRHSLDVKERDTAPLHDLKSIRWVDVAA